MRQDAIVRKLEIIGEAVKQLSARNDYLFTTGGIGPTHDDITVDAIAEALGVPVVIHPRARAMLELSRALASAPRMTFSMTVKFCTSMKC